MASEEKVSEILRSGRGDKAPIIFPVSWDEKDSAKSDLSNPVDFK
jgi:hypothetical protein